MWWARGNVTAAAEAFIQRSNAIKEKSGFLIKKRISRLSNPFLKVTLCGYYLNEVGRLYTIFGDRQKSAKFFRLASEAVPIFSYQKLNDVSMPDLRDAVRTIPIKKNTFIELSSRCQCLVWLFQLQRGIAGKENTHYTTTFIFII